LSRNSVQTCPSCVEEVDHNILDTGAVSVLRRLLSPVEGMLITSYIRALTALPEAAYSSDWRPVKE
jgi:hypothetical protein